MKEQIKDFIEKAKTWDRKRLESYKKLLFISVFIDLVGVYYYFKLKIVGTALIIVILACLAGVLMLERRLNDKMNDAESLIEELGDEEEEPEEKPKKKVKKKEEDSCGMDFGLPSAEEYQERMERAFGKIDI